MIFLLGIPLLIAAGAFILDNRITWKEFLVQVALQLVIVGTFGVAVYSGRLYDTEVWNGLVNKKWSETVHCRHGYPCNCREVCSGSGKNRSCYTHCDTCYMHSFDKDWNVQSTTGREWTIDTIDSQGLSEPPRWTQVQQGDPTSETHSFTNYLKASPDTLFNQQGVDLAKFLKVLPMYPLDIYDYYKLKRFIGYEAKITDWELWDSDLAKLNGRLGPSKQMNIIIVVVRNQPKEYFYALKQHWIGGKKNDTVVVLNLDNSNILTWTDIMSFTSSQNFIVVLRDDLSKIGLLDRQKVLSTIEMDSQLFVRKPMEEYTYLRYLFRPSGGELLFGLILGIISAIGLSYWMDQQDLFEN